MIHTFLTPDGRKTPDFPGGVESNHALVGVAEWAYGVTDWFEQGLYLPLYSFSHKDGATFNGFKVRELFVRPHAGRAQVFDGVNFEIQSVKSGKAVGIRGTTHVWKCGRLLDGTLHPGGYH